MTSPITVLQLAVFRGARPRAAGGVLTIGDIKAVGLPFLGACQRCGGLVSARSACLTRTGHLRCAATCIGTDGYATVEEAEDKW